MPEKIALTDGLSSAAAERSRPSITGFLTLAVCILLIGFGLRVWELEQPSLWADEIMTEYRVEAPLGDALENTLHTIDQTPLFFVALRLFPHGSEFLLRLPVALVGVVGLALVMVVARRLYHNNTLALWAGAWLAVNPYHVWLSRTARHYSLIFVFSLLIAYTFLLLWNGHTTRRNWAAFTISSLLGYITHYSLLALPFSQVVLLALTWRKRRDSAQAIVSARHFERRWVIAQVIAAAPMAVWFILMALTASSREPQWGERPWMGDLVLTLRNMTTGIDGPLAWYAVPGLVVVAGAALLLAWAWRRLPGTIRPITLYWLIQALLPMLLVFVLSVIALNAYIDRYFMALLPAMTLLIAYAWVVLARPLTRWATPLALVAVLLTGLVTVGRSLHNNTLQREDWRGVAAYIGQRYQPNDIFVVDRAVTMTAFRRYFTEHESPRVIQLSETDEPTPPDEIGARYWVIYRAPDEDIHRVGTLPSFDPLIAQSSVTADWLLAHTQYIVDTKVFDGVTILLLNLDQTVSQITADPTQKLSPGG